MSKRAYAFVYNKMHILMAAMLLVGYSYSATTYLHRVASKLVPLSKINRSLPPFGPHPIGALPPHLLPTPQEVAVLADLSPEELLKAMNELRRADMYYLPPNQKSANLVRDIEEKWLSPLYLASGHSKENLQSLFAPEILGHESELLGQYARNLAEATPMPGIKEMVNKAVARARIAGALDAMREEERSPLTELLSDDLMKLKKIAEANKINRANRQYGITPYHLKADNEWIRRVTEDPNSTPEKKLAAASLASDWDILEKAIAALAEMREKRFN